MEKNSWWNPQNYLQNINLTGAIDAIWDGVIVGDSKFNPEKSCYELADEYKHSGRSIESSAENFIQGRQRKPALLDFCLGLRGSFL